MKIVMLFALLVSSATGPSSAVRTPAVAVASAPQPSAPQPSAQTAWRWPVAGPGGSPPRLLRPFKPPALRWLAGHRGVDLAAAIGAPVLAAGRGRVTFAGTLFGQRVVVVAHGALRTSYEPVTPSVHAGDLVSAGSPIGSLATFAGGHCQSAACLHWGLLAGSGHAVRYYDPLLLLGLGRLRLEPVRGSPG